MAAPRVAPYGSWASPIEIELVAGTAVGLVRAVARRRRRVLARGPPGRGRTADAAPPRRRTARRAELTPGAVQRPATGSTSTAAARTPCAAAVVVSSSCRATAGCTGWIPTASAPPVAITPGGPWRYADLRFDPAPPAPVRRPRDARPGPRPTTRARGNESWRSRSTARTAPGASSSRARTSSPAPRPRRTARTARLARVGPPGHALGRGPAAGRGRRATTARSVTRGPSPAGPAISVVQPAWSPDGRLHFVSDETGWWNLYAFDGPDGLRATPATSPRWTAEFGDPAWVFGRSVVRVPARRRDPRGRPRRRPRRASCASSPDGTVAPLDTPFTEVEGLRDRRRRRRSRSRPGAHEASAAGPASTPATGRRRPASSRARCAPPLDPSVLPVARADHLPDRRRRHGPRAVLRALRTRRFRGPDGELPPLLVRVARRPDRSRVVGARRSTGRSSPRAASPSWTWTTAARPATGGRTATRSRAQWGIADVEDCVAAAQYLVERGARGPGAPRDPRRQRRRLHDARGAHVPAGGLRGRASATSASRTWSSSTSTATSSSRATTRGCWRPGPRRAAGSSASARRSTSWIASAPRCSSSRASTTGSCRRPRLDAMVAAFTARGLPARRDDVRGRGPRLPQGGDEAGDATAAELAFLGRVFGFTPADDLPPLEIPGLA